MLCENPRYCIINEQGKREFLDRKQLDLVKNNLYPTLNLHDKNGDRIKFIPVHQVPCGFCVLCQTSLRDEWALRCWLEAKEYDNNQFVTLTYSKKHLPEIGVDKNELTRFIHTLREYFRRKLKHIGIRFYGCGEYGKSDLRPHYHVLIFNCPSFGDEKYYKKNKGGQILYTSKILSRLWGKGFCTIGAVTRQSCKYVANYRLKYYFQKVPENFFIYNNQPFNNMSRGKGIGRDYLIKNFDQIIKEDSIRLTGKITVKLPKYYDRIIEKIIGHKSFEEKIATPRKIKAKKFIAEEKARTGLSETELYQQKVAEKKHEILCSLGIKNQGSKKK